MRVLLVTQHYWPESFRINEVVQSLREIGCKLTVLTGQPNYPEGRTFAGYRWYDVTRIGCDEGLDVLRVPLVPRGSASAARLIANYLSFVFSAALFGAWLLRGRKFDVIFVYASSPVLQSIPAIVLKQLKRVPLVTWVQDLWPQSLEVTGFVTNRSLLALVAACVRWIYRRNDLLLVQSRAFVAEVESMAGGVQVRYHPNPGELSLSDASHSGEPGEVVLEPGFNVVFAGNLGTAQSLDTILCAAEILREQPHIRIVLVGSGSRGDWLVEEVRRRGLENVRLAGRVRPSSMPGVFQQASALLVSLVRDPAMSLTVPSKVQAYLAAARPIIASLDGETARLVLEAGAGIVCPAEDAAGLANAILDMSAMPAEARVRMGAAGRDYYVSNFEPRKLAKELAATFRELTDLCGKY